MTSTIIAIDVTTQQDYNIAEYETITIFNRGGTSNTVVYIGVDTGRLVQKLSIAADTITTINDKAAMLRIIPGTGANVDIVGSVR